MEELAGEIEVDESYFGGVRKGKRPETSDGRDGNGPPNDNPSGENKVPENNGSSNPDTNGNGDTSNAANDNDGALDDFARTEPEANFGSGGATPNGSPFTPNPNLPLPESLQGHIINGTAKGNRRSGAHYAGSPNVRIDESTIQLDPAGTGAFTAVVEIKDAAGNFKKKTNSPPSIGAGRSTFFPRSWTPERIIGEIAAAAKQVPDGTIGTITSPSGLKITITKDDSGKVVQAFPEI